MSLLNDEALGLKYLRVANSLRRKIIGGVYQEGERLPSQHKLTKSYGVALNTLRQALDLLQREGYIVRKIGSGTYVRLPGKTKGSVLVVDDEETIRQLFVQSLSNDGWGVEAVGSGPEALERLEKRTYDLIFLDLLMPAMNGAVTFREIRKMDFEVPVVIITGYPDSDVMAEALQTGPFAGMKKPLSLDEVRRVLGRSGARSGAMVP